MDHISNKFMALKSWRDICKSKEAESLGFRMFSEFNMALLAKLAWKLASGEDALWTKVLGEKYLKGKFFFEMENAKGSSMT